MRVVVIGVGTAHGDDGIGAAVAERLAREGVPAHVRVLAVARPVPDVLDALEGAEAAVLVDATQSGRTPGTVWQPDPAAPRPDRVASSHALGVAEALALAQALGRTPRRLALVGIEAERHGGDTPSAAAQHALPEAVAAVRRVLEGWSAAEGEHARA